MVPEEVPHGAVAPGGGVGHCTAALATGGAAPASRSAETFVRIVGTDRGRASPGDRLASESCGERADHQATVDGQSLLETASVAARFRCRQRRIFAVFLHRGSQYARRWFVALTKKMPWHPSHRRATVSSAPA